MTGSPTATVHDLVVDAAGRLTAASSNLDGGHKGGGVYRWCDGAWTEAAPGLPDAAVYGAGHRRAGNVYAAVRGARAYRLAGDGGWRDVSPELADAKGYGIGVTPGGSVLLATSEGVVRSADQGATWKTIAAGLASRTVYAFACGGDTVYAGTEAVSTAHR